MMIGLSVCSSLHEALGKDTKGAAALTVRAGDGDADRRQVRRGGANLHGDHGADGALLHGEDADGLSSMAKLGVGAGLLLDEQRGAGAGEGLQTHVGRVAAVVRVHRGEQGQVVACRGH